MPIHVTTTTTQTLCNKGFSGPVRFDGNVTIFGDLSCNGTQTFNNTIFSTTSAVSVVHVGSGPALWVGNNGIGDIASFYDIDANVEVLHVGGNNGTFPNVGVKTSTPNVDFTVNGAISAASIIYDASGNSNQWNNTYTFVQSQSSNNDSVFTTVQTYSATNWNYQGTDIKALTGNWDSTYSTVQTYSATTWNPAGKYLPLSGGTINGSINVATGQILSGGIDISTFFGGGGGSQTLSFNESNADLTISSGNTVSLSALSGSSGGSVVYTYITNGTWTNPSPTIARPVTITLIGGGGGGGSGRSDNTGTTCGGGGAGAGAGLVMFNTYTNLLSAFEDVIVGAGGAGGARTIGQGDDGGNGNPTTMTLSGITLRAIGGALGNNGTSAAAGGGGPVTNSTVCFNNVAINIAGGNGSSGAANATSPAAATYFVPTGGGGGGGVNAANTLFTAAAGGGFFAITTLNLINGAAVGVGAGASGSNGYSYLGVGAGGAGGNASNVSGTLGGNGGAGGFPGGGGGGGGGYGVSGGAATQSGAGGAGGNGVATIIVY